MSMSDVLDEDTNFNLDLISESSSGFPLVPMNSPKFSSSPKLEKIPSFLPGEEEKNMLPDPPGFRSITMKDINVRLLKMAEDVLPSILKA